MEQEELTRETKKHVQRTGGKSGIAVKKRERRALDMRESGTKQCQMPQRKGKDRKVHIGFSNKEVNG